jgi:hypothetical protein
MKDNLLRFFAAQQFHRFDTEEIHVVDYANQSNDQRGIEAHAAKPHDIESFTAKNPKLIAVFVSPFRKGTLRGDGNKEIKHCECVLFPEGFVEPRSWVLFLEMKYSKPGNSGGDITTAMNQLFSTLHYCRSKSIIAKRQKVYLIASIPNNKAKEPFESHIYSPEDLLRFYREEFAIVRGVSTVEIIDDTKLKV